MKLLATILTIQITGFTVLQARIGDTPQQCENRYLDSSLTQVKNQGEWMRKDGIITRCFFTQDKCAAVIYDLAAGSRVIYPEFDKRPIFTEDQVLKLLALNGGDSKWKKKIDDHHGESFHGIYVTEDGKFHAMVNRAGVTVETIEYQREMSEKISKSSVDATIAKFGITITPTVNTHAGRVEKTDYEIESEKQTADLNKSLDNLQKSLDAQKKLSDTLQQLEDLNKDHEPELPSGMSKGSQ